MFSQLINCIKYTVSFQTRNTPFRRCLFFTFGGCLICLVSKILSSNHSSLAESLMLFTLFTVSDSTILDLELPDLFDLVTTLFGFMLVTVLETTFLFLDTLFDFTLIVSVTLGELVDLAVLLDLFGLAEFEACSISAVKF